MRIKQNAFFHNCFGNVQHKFSRQFELGIFFLSQTSKFHTLSCWAIEVNLRHAFIVNKNQVLRVYRQIPQQLRIRIRRAQLSNTFCIYTSLHRSTKYLNTVELYKSGMFKNILQCWSVSNLSLLFVEPI